MQIQFYKIFAHRLGKFLPKTTYLVQNYLPKTTYLVQKCFCSGQDEEVIVFKLPFLPSVVNLSVRLFVHRILFKYRHKVTVSRIVWKYKPVIYFTRQSANTGSDEIRIISPQSDTPLRHLGDTIWNDCPSSSRWRATKKMNNDRLKKKKKIFTPDSTLSTFTKMFHFLEN